MKVIYKNEEDEFDIGLDIMHIRKGLEAINAGCHNDIGLYNPKNLLERAIKLESKLIDKDFYKKNRLAK